MSSVSVPPAESSSDFTDLATDLRAKAQMITDTRPKKNQKYDAGSANDLPDWRRGSSLPSLIRVLYEYPFPLPSSFSIPTPFLSLSLISSPIITITITKITPLLSSAGHACLTLDTHGSGLSPCTGAGNSISFIAADALGLLDTITITANVVLVGHSMGSIVATHLATTAPALIRAVVLIGPVNLNPGAADVFSKRIAVVERKGMGPLAATIPTAATGSRARTLVHAFVRALLLGSDPAGYVSLCHAIAEAVVPACADVRAPLLVLAGGEDNSALLEGVEAIMEGCGSANKEMRILMGVSHWHVLEAWEEVGEIIAGFLRGL
ncbi:hypothetical protein VE02_09101 [Pseudogymnoascus sp. 03VT05]|nr:hypothetical protein VE02_09101 [Pseudogymnoascus sp. 03VT05]